MSPKVTADEPNQTEEGITTSRSAHYERFKPSWTSLTPRNKASWPTCWEPTSIDSAKNRAVPGKKPVGASRSRNANVRLIAATNADLQSQVYSGAFRKDLFFRLNTVEIHIPPLSQRPEDIPPLAHLFLQQFRQKYKRFELEFSKSAMADLRSRDDGTTWLRSIRLQEGLARGAVLFQPHSITFNSAHRCVRIGGEGQGVIGERAQNGRSVAEECRRVRETATLRRSGALAPAKDALL